MHLGCRLLSQANRIFRDVISFVAEDPSRSDIVDSNFQDKRCSVSSLLPAFLNGIFNLEFCDTGSGILLPAVLELLRCVNHVSHDPFLLRLFFRGSYPHPAPKKNLISN